MKPSALSFENSAPGRMDVMGGIADYSGSLVLQMAIRRKTNVTVSLHNEGIFRVTSDNEGGNPLHTEIALSALLKNGAVEYAEVNRVLRSTESLWAGYVVGCALVLMRERDVRIQGADFRISSDVPIGKGVSSSASLEVATMKALADALQISLEGTALPVLAQRVENLIVGAPCGLMDQLASYFGTPGKLLPIVCQPDKVLEEINVPAEMHFVGIDSGVRHSVGGTNYGDVRCAAFMGYTIIANSLGVNEKEIGLARTTGGRSALPFGGYLCNISVHDFQQRFRSILPESITGADFIRQFGSTVDALSSIDLAKEYQIRECTAHPVFENERVHEFKRIVERKTLTEGQWVRLGQLMFESHESYSRCGLGSERTDEIVNRAKEFLNDDVFGAKITGGGSGGTVCVLAKGQMGLEHAYKIHRQFSSKYKTTLSLIE